MKEKDDLVLLVRLILVESAGRTTSQKVLVYKRASTSNVTVNESQVSCIHEALMERITMV